jgi:hypothetical protein
MSERPNVSKILHVCTAKGDYSVRVDQSSHSPSNSPRKPRNHFFMPFLPLGIPGLPIPVYFLKGLSFRTTVVCSLLASFACFFMMRLHADIEEGRWTQAF